MVAIVVLTIAIVPMVGMFDAAIHASKVSGKYDEARTCAVQRLEQAKTLTYELVEAGLQDGICESSGFGYEIVSQPVDLDLGDGSGEEGLTMITVTVDWDGGNSYDVSGVVSRW